MPTFITEGIYPFEFICGDRSTLQIDNVLIANGQNLPTAAVIAKTFVGTAAGSNAAGNTGNPTVGAIAVGAFAESGLYKAIFTGPTNFEVFSPGGRFLGAYATGAAAVIEGRLTFTLTVGGVAAVAGDEFDIFVTEGASTYQAATGGDAVGILGAAVNATAGATAGLAVTRLCEFNPSLVNYGTMDAAHIAAANAALAQRNVIARSGM